VAAAPTPPAAAPRAKPASPAPAAPKAAAAPRPDFNTRPTQPIPPKSSTTGLRPHPI
jgi:hypothetical protein